MNIREAKEEIKKTVWAYTARTSSGTYRIPIQRQRPILMIGPPGIGKTAVMEQIASECSLGLVAYTMTHHTRQSAIGLPVLEKKTFAGQEYTITAYTMSEIIASVYEQIEKTGRKEGILFLDEINCVSETLMPAMLQFLQYKTFGSHRLPKGWVIVAAGNPSAYNRSVREFDTVTLDRVKKMEIEPDLDVWKRYALERMLHPAVLSFLELQPECFYVMEDGRKGFVTGRGWEDLSEMLLTMEELDLTIEDSLFGQYLQHAETARKFAFYYRLFEKWKERLHPEEILQGKGELPGKDLPKLPFDERMCILWLLLQRLYRQAEDAEEKDSLARSLLYFTEGTERAGGSAEEACEEQLSRRSKGLQVKKECGLLEPEEEARERKLADIVRICMQEARLSGEKVPELRKQAEKLTGEAGTMQAEAAQAMEHAVSFVRQTFGESQELMILLTGLLEHPKAGKLLKEKLPELYEGARLFLSADRKEEELRKRLQ